jgi:predicted outer membrane repeat protein
MRPRLELLEDRRLPSTLTVTNNLDSGSGSLRAEIAAAKNNDTIVFDPSLDGQTITLTTGELYVNTSLSINGPGAAQLTVSGAHSSRIFEVAAKNQVVLSGLTISSGNGSVGNGGAIYNSGELNVSNCTLTGNQPVQSGGAIFNLGTVTVTGSNLSGNSAASGGAIYNQGNLTVSPDYSHPFIHGPFGRL